MLNFRTLLDLNLKISSTNLRHRSQGLGCMLVFIVNPVNYLLDDGPIGILLSDCIDGDGSYSCECHDSNEIILEEVQALTNDWVCVDKDECSNVTWNECDVNSVCENLDPSYQCNCNEGWNNCADINIEILGTCCENRDECAQDAPCASFADCTDLIGLWPILSNDEKV